MAIRYQLIERAPADVWSVLADPYRYADWVVGTAETAPREGDWPELGSSLSYTIPLGPRVAEGYTVVRRFDPPQYLELEARSGIGSARIAFEIRPWGENTLVIVDEHPLSGLGNRLHNTLLDAVIQLRHRGMLARLARVVEETHPRARGEKGAASPARSSASGEAGHD
ncbi:SRPBCC family protein [Streptomyces sp. NPDC003656]|uniref:SRPBCC family protein n=1 Tax=unclassified Streptomyces TaxID=2593676 RepID=UPI0018F5DB6D|nr:SRPBCC family protein [Streptomyces sp. DSM 110735]MBJ7905615.1 SRPBCC family protein [Streptomyces sp. DSM 110735]